MRSGDAIADVLEATIMGRASPERIRVVLHQLDVKPAVGVRRVHGLIQRAKRIVIDGPVAEIADRVAPLHCLDDVHTYSPYTGLRCRSTPSIMKTMTGRDEDGGFTQHIPSNILATARACVHRVVRRLPGFPGRGPRAAIRPRRRARDMRDARLWRAERL